MGGAAAKQVARADTDPQGGTAFGPLLHSPFFTAPSSQPLLHSPFFTAPSSQPTPPAQRLGRSDKVLDRILVLALRVAEEAENQQLVRLPPGERPRQWPPLPSWAPLVHGEYTW